MSTGQRIRSGRERLGLTEQAFANRIGVSRGAVQQWEKDTTAPKRKNQQAVADLIGISVSELMFGSSFIDVEASFVEQKPAQALTHQAPVAINLENNPDYPAVRRVSVKAQAGIVGYAVEDVHDSAPIVFRADWYKSKGYRPERLLALRVAGESMAPGLYPDDLIVVNTESTAPKDGVPYLVAYEGEVIVKRLVRDAGAWWLTSDNPDQRRYARKLCDEHTQLIGEVIYKQSERV